MPLVSMGKLLADAEKGNYAVGGFNVANMEMVMGVIRAAEELRSPVILQIAQIRLGPSPLELIGPAMVAAAKSANVPVAVNFDHGTTKEKIAQALKIGFNSVMIDGSALELDGNIQITNEVKALAAGYGATVEAEIGSIGEHANTDIQYTDVGQAVRFYQSTKIDALAIAIGNAHGIYHCTPKLNFDVLSAVHEKLQVPLVLHGGSGLSEDDFKTCIRLGMRKINVATATFGCVEGHVCHLYQNKQPIEYFTLHEAEIAGACENVKRHILIFGSQNNTDIK
jgi:fructose-bisphosphate aldolase class II